MKRRCSGLAVLAAVVAAAPAPAQQPAIPIPGPLDGPLPRFTGAPATAHPLPGPYRPANPALAGDGRSGTGLAASNGAASPFPGPLGRGTARASTLAFGCASLAFDARDRLLALCNGPLGAALRLVDPASLATLSILNLPPRANADMADRAGGTHFLVRADGTVVLPTNAGTLLEVAVDGDALRQRRAIGLGGLLAEDERPFAVAAGYDGFDWVAGTAGTVVTLPRGGGAPRRLALGEPIAEDLATDPTGAYVVTRDALYRLQATADGTPRVVWREALRSTTIPDPRSGRVHPGPGTPPVMVAGGYVAVADGLSPPRINVFRVASRSSRRLACSVPVFGAGAGSIEAHLVVAGRSVVASNAHGLQNLMTTEGGRTTTGGLARVVVGKRGCRTAWTVPAISPSAQPVVSRATGLLYTLVKPKGFPDAWNLAAIDWRTGETRFEALAGEGLGFNSDGGAVALSPDGTAWAGTFGGLVRFRDGV